MKKRGLVLCAAIAACLVIAIFLGGVALYPKLRDAYEKRNAVFLTQEYIVITRKPLYSSGVQVHWETSWAPIAARIAFEYQDQSGEWIRAQETEISIADTCQFVTPNGENANIRILARAVSVEETGADGTVISRSWSSGFAQFDIHPISLFSHSTEQLWTGAPVPPSTGRGREYL